LKRKIERIEGEQEKKEELQNQNLRGDIFSRPEGKTGHSAGEGGVSGDEKGKKKGRLPPVLAI